MNLEIITIGREILDGRVVDNNAVFLGQELKRRGLTPRFAQRVDDDHKRLCQAFDIAQKRSQWVICTGGLGPTRDDLSVEAFARFLGKPLLENAEAKAHLEAVFKRHGREIVQSQWKQVLFPEGARVLQNKEGTAPGLYMKDSTGCQWVFLPGVPREMKPMFLEEVLPLLPTHKLHEAVWKTQFTSEGELQERLRDVVLPEFVELSFRTHFPENHVSLFASPQSTQDEEIWAECVKKIEVVFSEDSFSSGEELEEVVVALAKKEGFRMATVESCTGGLVAHRLTDIPGSSETFAASWVCYDNQAKISLAQDSKKMRNALDSVGAVSQEVAALMAEGAIEKLHQFFPHEKNLIAVSTTGIAGPGGGSAEKAVGTCFLGVAQKGEATRLQKIEGSSYLDRERLKRLFSQHALELLRKSLLSKSL